MTTHIDEHKFVNGNKWNKLRIMYVYWGIQFNLQQ